MVAMTAPHQSLRQSDRGFSLVELLVVISIIALLSTVVLASLSSSRQKGRDARRLADMQQIQLALAQYRGINESYPNCLYAGTSNSGTACGTSLEGSTVMTTVPRDPKTGLGYAYAHVKLEIGTTNCASGPTYHLGAALEDQTHPALDTDRDAPSADLANGGRCSHKGLTLPAYDFYGLSFQSAGSQVCNFYSGDTGTVATETCYDVMP